MNRFLLILRLSTVLLCICLLYSCTKEPIAIDNGLGLPNATESGANTFGCAITGIGPTNSPAQSICINDDNPNDPEAASSGNGTWYNNDTLTIAGIAQAGSYFKSIQFIIVGTPKAGNTYTIDSVNTIGIASTFATCSGVFLSLTTSISDSGTIQLTNFDTVNKIVSGTFTCNFTFPQCDSTIYATQGRFDYKYASN